MKKLLIMFVMLLSVISINADDNKKFVCENNVYSILSTGGKSEATKTTFTWKDKKGNDYPIYISATGSCFVIRTSAKTGKEYKHYLGKEISEDICKKLGREYKGKTKK